MAGPRPVNPGMAVVIFGDKEIAIKDEMFNLTQMHKAVNGTASQRPANWAQREGATFIDHIKAKYENRTLVEAKRGGRPGNAGTWAHWQIALAYAKYLSHDFHAWANEQIMRLGYAQQRP